MSLDGVVYVVRLFEVLINAIAINDSGNITWPKLVDEQNSSSVDGVLMLYDVTNEESVIKIPDILSKSQSGSIRLPGLLMFQCDTQPAVAFHHRR